MTKKYLIDTDILIDYLRGNLQAKQFLARHSGHLLISTVTVAELYSGIRNNSELQILEDLFMCFAIMPLETSIAKEGGGYLRKYYRSHGTGLADALIAATAMSHGSYLVSLNKKHFPGIQKLLIPYVK